MDFPTISKLCKSFSHQQCQCLDSLCSLISENDSRNNDVKFNESHYCDNPFNILRWLIAYEFNAYEAFKNLQRHLVIRKIRNLDGIEEEIQNFEEIYTTCSSMNILGRNKKNNNRIAVIELLGRCDICDIIDNIQETQFMKYRFYLMEQILREVNRVERETNQISSAILLINLESVQLNTNLINAIKGPFRVMWGTLLEQYPGLFSQIIVINSPSFINVLWPICSNFIDDNYREKITVLSDDWENEISKYIESNQLRIFFNGILKHKHFDHHFKSIASSPTNNKFHELEMVLNKYSTELSVPAGKFSIAMYNLDEKVNLEFYMRHECGLSMGIYYSIDDKSNKWNVSEVQEVYARCERLSLATVDHWKWQTPSKGFYYISYGNERSWFMSINVKHVINRIDGDRSAKIEPMKRFLT